MSNTRERCFCTLPVYVCGCGSRIKDIDKESAREKENWLKSTSELCRRWQRCFANVVAVTCIYIYMLAYVCIIYTNTPSSFVMLVFIQFIKNNIAHTHSDKDDSCMSQGTRFVAWAREKSLRTHTLTHTRTAKKAKPRIRKWLCLVFLYFYFLYTHL